MKLNITCADTTDPAALAHHYSGQQHPQPVFIALDLEDGRMWADYSGEIGTGTPESVWYGRVRRYYWPTGEVPTTEAANRIMDEIAPLAQTVLDHSDTCYDRHGNHVGGVGGAGAAAERRIEALLERLDGSDMVACIDAYYWWHTIPDEELADMGDMSITADTTDEQIAAIVPLYYRHMESDMEWGALICDDLEDYLLSRRDDMREEGHNQ